MEKEILQKAGQRLGPPAASPKLSGLTRPVDRDRCVNRQFTALQRELLRQEWMALIGKQRPCPCLCPLEVGLAHGVSMFRLIIPEISQDPNLLIRIARLRQCNVPKRLCHWKTVQEASHPCWQSIGMEASAGYDVVVQ